MEWLPALYVCMAMISLFASSQLFKQSYEPNLDTDLNIDTHKYYDIISNDKVSNDLQQHSQFDPDQHKTRSLLSHHVKRKDDKANTDNTKHDIDIHPLVSSPQYKNGNGSESVFLIPNYNVAISSAKQTLNLIYQRFEYHNWYWYQFFLGSFNMPTSAWDVLKYKVAKKSLDTRMLILSSHELKLMLQFG